MPSSILVLLQWPSRTSDRSVYRGEGNRAAVDLVMQRVRGALLMDFLTVRQNSSVSKPKKQSLFRDDRLRFQEQAFRSPSNFFNEQRYEVNAFPSEQRVVRIAF